MSAIRGLLWIFNIALTFFILAMTVSPQAAAQNFATWLNYLGLKTTAGALVTHAGRKIHLSTHSAPHYVSQCAPHCATQPGESGLDVPELALFAAAILVASLVVVWLLRSRRRSLLEA